MITPALPVARSGRPDSIPAPSKINPAPQGPRLDQISIENAVFLRAELGRQPEIRSEVVARARALAKDPGYPPLEAVRAVAEQILRSPDLTEDAS